jgi:hypothetical protein
VSKKNFRTIIYLTLAFCALLYFINVPLEAALCAPWHGESWADITVLQNCSRLLPFAIIQGSLNVVVDFWLLWIPVPIIWNLNMKADKKLFVAGIFMTAIL